MALIVVGLTLEAGATGAVKAIKVSVKLLVGQSSAAPSGQPDDAAPTRDTKTSGPPALR